MNTMKAWMCKTLATLLALCGVFGLGFGLFPLLSPIGWAFCFGERYNLAAILSFPGSALLGYLALRLSRQGHTLSENKANNR
jgi:hypothetical protein